MSLISIGDFSVGKIRLRPGWRWSKDVRPIVNTESCQLGHKEYVIAGRLRVIMNDGSAHEFGPGDVMVVPPGHDGWVVGKKTYVALEFSSPTKYAIAPKNGETQENENND